MPLGRANDHTRLRVADVVFELGQRVADIKRQVDRAGAQAGEVEHDGVCGFLHLRRHAIAGHHAALYQRVGDMARALDGVRRGDLAAVRGLDEGGGGDALAHDLEKIVAHRNVPLLKL